MRPLSRGVVAAARLALVLSAALAASCGEGRFPVCKSNADCTPRDAGPGGSICFNLRCVECVYDSDCQAGRTCNRNLNECQGISDLPGGGPTEDAGVSWEPGSWDECATRCKEPACIRECDERFKK